MSITSEITALTTDRNNIRTALVNKGISAASAHGFDDFATDIGTIVSDSSFIVVTAPTGSTVTCDGVSAAESGGTWTFSGIAIGTHTIVATKTVGEQTFTKTVTQVVDVVGIYPVTITYSRLPDGYTEVEYIEGTGTQYIDTNIHIDDTTRVLLDFKITEHKNWQTPFGVNDYTASTTDNPMYAVQYSGTAYTLNILFQQNYIYSAPNIGRSRGVLDFNNNKVFKYNNNTLTTTTNTIPRTADASLYLFANYIRSSGAVQGITKMECYSFKCYKSGSLVSDLVPCINSSNAVGMYDLVSNTFFGNSGTGVFVAGNPV